MTRLELKCSTTTPNVRGSGRGGGHRVVTTSRLPYLLPFCPFVFRLLQRSKIGSPGLVLKLWGNLPKVKIVTGQFS